MKNKETSQPPLTCFINHGTVIIKKLVSNHDLAVKVENGQIRTFHFKMSNPSVLAGQKYVLQKKSNLFGDLITI